METDYDNEIALAMEPDGKTEDEGRAKSTFHYNAAVLQSSACCFAAKVCGGA